MKEIRADRLRKDRHRLALALKAIQSGKMARRNQGEASTTWRLLIQRIAAIDRLLEDDAD